MSNVENIIKTLEGYVSSLEEYGTRFSCNDDKDRIDEVQILIDRLKHDKDKRITHEDGFILNEANSWHHEISMGHVLNAEMRLR